MVIDLDSTRGVRYRFWYNTNGNVIFGLVGIQPAMEVQCNGLDAVSTQMIVQFWFYMVWLPHWKYNFVFAQFLYPNVSTIFNLVGFCTKM